MTLDEPTMAGVHDALLGGIANYDPDRRLVEEVSALSPLPVRLEREHREFVRRAAGWFGGVSAVLDLGCGAPRDDSVFELVAAYLRRLSPGSLLVLTHPSADTAPELHAVAELLPGHPTLRTRHEVAALLPAGTAVVPLPHLLTGSDRRTPVGQSDRGRSPRPDARYPYYAAVVRC